MKRDNVSDDRDMTEVISLLGKMGESMNDQSFAIQSLSLEVGKMGTAMGFYKEQSEKLEKIIGIHEGRLRDVEIVEARCSNRSDIKSMEKQITRLSAFMDMIKTKAEEDTSIIDVHAQQMQHSAAMTIQSSGELWKMFSKYGPWIIVAMLAVASVSGFIVAKMVGIDVPNVTITDKAKSSSHDPKAP